MAIVALEYTKLNNNDIYLTYIDFSSAFGSINHSKLLALLEKTCYPKDTIELVGNIYTNSTTSFHGSHFGTTSPMHINCNTI